MRVNWMTRRFGSLLRHWLLIISFSRCSDFLAARCEQRKLNPLKILEERRMFGACQSIVFRFPCLPVSISLFTTTRSKKICSVFLNSKNSFFSHSNFYTSWKRISCFQSKLIPIIDYHVQNWNLIHYLKNNLFALYLSWFYKRHRRKNLTANLLFSFI